MNLTLKQLCKCRQIILEAYSGVSITSHDIYRVAVYMAKGDDQLLGFILGFATAWRPIPSVEEIMEAGPVSRENAQAIHRAFGGKKDGN